MKEEKMIYPKIKQLGYTDILVSADYTGSSTLILEGQEQARSMKQIQTVLAVGPHSLRSEDRAGFVPGDRVVLDIDKVMAKRENNTQATGVRLITIPYNNKTGKVLFETKKDDLKAEDVSYGVMLDPRSILMVLE